MTSPQTDAPERIYDYDIDEVKSALNNVAATDIPYCPNLVKGVMMDAAHVIDARDAVIADLVEALERIADLSSHNMGMSARDERCVNAEVCAALVKAAALNKR